MESRAADWRASAASLVLVLSEVTFGASPAWSGLHSQADSTRDDWQIAVNELSRQHAALAASASAAVDEFTQLDEYTERGAVTGRLVMQLARCLTQGRAIADATLRPQQCAACWSSVSAEC